MPIFLVAGRSACSAFGGVQPVRGERAHDCDRLALVVKIATGGRYLLLRLLYNWIDGTCFERVLSTTDTSVLMSINCVIVVEVGKLVCRYLIIVHVARPIFCLSPNVRLNLFQLFDYGPQKGKRAGLKAQQLCCPLENPRQPLHYLSDLHFRALRKPCPTQSAHARNWCLC